MTAAFCELCGLRVDGPGRCKACGGDRIDASDYPKKQVKTDKKSVELGAVAPGADMRDKREEK